MHSSLFHQVHELLCSSPEYVRVLASRRSLVAHMRHNLTQSLSNNNSVLEQEARSSSPSKGKGSLAFSSRSILLNVLHVKACQNCCDVWRMVVLGYYSLSFVIEMIIMYIIVYSTQ